MFSIPLLVYNLTLGFAIFGKCTSNYFISIEYEYLVLVSDIFCTIDFTSTMYISYIRIPAKWYAIASLSLLPNPPANGFTMLGNRSLSYFIKVAFTRSDVLTNDSFLIASIAYSGSIIIGPSHLTYFLAYYFVMEYIGNDLIVIQTTLYPF